MPGHVVFIRKKRTDATQLENTFPTIQRGKLIYAHQLLSQFGVIEAMGNLAPTGFTRVVAVDGFFPKALR